MTDIFYITRAKLSLRRAHVHNILRTADSLSRAGHRVTVMTTASMGDDAGIREANDVGGDFAITHVRSLVGALWKERARGRVCYVRDPMLWGVVAMARMMGYRVLVEIHGSTESVPKRIGFLLLYRAAHGVLFITEHLRAWYRPRRKPYAVIPCVGLRDEELRATDTYDYRSALNIAREKIIAVYVGGGMSKYYDLSILVRALPLTDERVVMVIVGIKEEERVGIAALARALRVEERMFFCERFAPKQTLAYVRGADVLVSPKVWAPDGGVSSKYYAYLAAGKPIVASDTAVDREVLDDVCAMLVSPTETAFATALNVLAHDEAMRAHMGAHGRARVEQFSESVRTATIMSVMNDIHV